MKYKLIIQRQKSKTDKPYIQSFFVEADTDNTTVAAVLSMLNSQDELYDSEGKRCDKIRWECSCLQKKCGACAMVINGRPCLACDARLINLGSEITIQPLKKFPVIADLMIDRGILYENLKEINAWLTDEAYADEKRNDILYEASRCLQCGCCLEICPNFYTEGDFFGMAAMVPSARILDELNDKKKTALKKEYSKHIYNGCGKSLACRDICPAGINIEKLLVNSNTIAVWKSLFLRNK